MITTLKDTARVTPGARARLFSLAALGLVSLGLAAAPARAQTQDLFVSNAGNNTISRFAGTGPGTFSTTATTLSDPNGTLNSPEGLAFDAKGDLFAANDSGNSNDQGSITEFAAGAKPGTFGATSTLSDPNGTLNSPFGLAVDAKGDLFAANFFGKSITEFAAGTAPGTFGTPTTLTGGGLNKPFGLAVDAKGDLFAANFGNSNGPGNSITEFASTGPGTFGTATTLTGGGLNKPVGLAFDAKGDLFAANNGSNNITEFAFTPGAGTTPGTFGTGAVVATGLDFPLGLAIDARGDLFVINQSQSNSPNGQDSVAEFALDPATGTFGAAQTVETGLINPTFLAFGPSVSAPVPEASGAVSLGLLLALGLGGVVVAARKKRKA